MVSTIEHSLSHSKTRGAAGVWPLAGPRQHLTQPQSWKFLGQKGVCNNRITDVICKEGVNEGDRLI